MNICLIHPPAPELIDDRIDPPTGLLYLATALKSYGHNVRILDFAGNQSPAIPPADIYGMTLYTTSYPEAILLRDRIRSISSSPVMVGGPHASALPEKTAKDFDYVVVGEAEVTLPPLIERMAAREHPNNVIYCAAPQKLDDLMYNDYSLVDIASYNRIVAGEKAFSILSSRGCPWRCKYCTTSTLEQKVRSRSVEHVIGELILLDRQYGVIALRFIDDNFLMNLPFLRRFAPRLKEYEKPYKAYGRASDLSEETVDLLADSGCKMVACGVESGSQEMHEKMGTKKSVKKMIEGITLARKRGINIRVGILMGFPGETWDTVKESLNNLRKMPFNSYNLYNFVPFPGTEPFNNPGAFGITWISSNWKDFFLLHGHNETNYAFEHRDLDRKTLAEMRAFMISELDKIALPSLKDKEFK